MFKTLFAPMIQVAKKLSLSLVIFSMAFTLLFAAPNVALAMQLGNGGDMLFFNGTDATGDMIFTYDSDVSADDNCQTSGTACYNYDNKTQSLIITGFAKPGTRIKVYDAASGSTDDDYAVIDILPDLPPMGAVISNFEQTIMRPGYRMGYVKKDGLNGGISHITIQP